MTEGGRERGREEEKGRERGYPAKEAPERDGDARHDRGDGHAEHKELEETATVSGAMHHTRYAHAQCRVCARARRGRSAPC